MNAAKRVEGCATEATTLTRCRICREFVENKRKPLDRLFAILPFCNHPVCVTCMLEWKKDRRRLECPACLIQVPFYVPSSKWLDLGPQKRSLITGRVDYMAQTPCKFYNGGAGHCWFKDRCLYSHQRLQPEAPCSTRGHANDESFPFRPDPPDRLPHAQERISHRWANRTSRAAARPQPRPGVQPDQRSFFEAVPVNPAGCAQPSELSGECKTVTATTNASGVPPARSLS